MPSDKKRVNLTIPDEVVAELDEFMDVNFFRNYATTALWLMRYALSDLGFIKSNDGGEKGNEDA